MKKYVIKNEEGKYLDKHAVWSDANHAETFDDFDFVKTLLLPGEKAYSVTVTQTLTDEKEACEE